VPASTPLTASCGSIWHRWDPHVHLPGTLRNDNFGDTTVSEALNILASRTPPIEAIGVTDYATTVSYYRALEAQGKGAGQGIELFPNVELRLSHATNRDVAINLHLLAPPSQVDELDRFLGGLESVFADRTYRCDMQGLRDLGRAYGGDPSLPEAAALSQGANQFKLDFEHLRTQFERSAWAKEHLLVAVAAGSGDGTSGLRTPDHAFNALRQSIERFAHFMFTGNPQQVAFWLGQGADNEATLLKRYRGKKACLHGSDAHDAEHLGLPAEQRYCWIKGTPSFDTLRLACLSPETRVYVGSVDPMDGYRHGRISRIDVPDVDWFPADGVAINPGLVAIIGPRGSGKTALADLIAAGAGSTTPFENPQSFVRRAGRLVEASTSKLGWTHGDATESRLLWDGSISPTELGSVRYLSQQFVEQLCAGDGVSDNLLREIERVVFESYPPADRLGATTFGELLAIRLQGSRGRQVDELSAIAVTSQRITEERLLTRSLQGRREELGRDRLALSTLDGKINELVRHGTKGNADRLAVVARVLEARSSAVQVADRRHTELVALADRIESVKTTTFPQTSSALRREYPHAGLTDEEWAAFRPVFAGPVEDIVEAARAKAKIEVETIRGSSTQVPASNLDSLGEPALGAQTVAALRAEVERLQQLIGLDKKRAADLDKYNAQAVALRAKVKKAEEELAHAEGANERSADLVTERLAHYSAYFDALLNEEDELRVLYEPLALVLAEFGGTASKLQLAVRRRVDVAAWAAAGEELLDLRTEGAFRGAGSLLRFAEEKLLPAWEAGDGDAAADAIKSFSTDHSDDLRRQGKARDGSPDEVRAWETHINQWLYGADHISLGYTLTYDRLSIERLSPGLRGIVLLLLYLAVDRTESEPLIIDQPEENLDPESVYTELVLLFREASRRRQIIMVTHNANLVVNTDVDQVLVAHCEGYEEGRLPILTYSSGGLEEAEIRQHVCEVLEGGAEAFRQRALRLRLTV
jgi:energy-coupling factor transporter ATP-binding protein EcfA2